MRRQLPGRAVFGAGGDEPDDADRHHGHLGGLACCWRLLTLAGLSGPVVFFGLTVFMGIGNGVCLPNANAGHPVGPARPGGHRLGPGRRDDDRRRRGAGGPGGRLLAPGSTEMPLILLMLASSLASVVAILLVIRRARTGPDPLDAGFAKPLTGFAKRRPRWPPRNCMPASSCARSAAVWR
jgi:hypothetical protein